MRINVDFNMQTKKYIECYIIYDKKLMSLLIKIVVKYQSNFLYFLCKKIRL